MLWPELSTPKLAVDVGDQWWPTGHTLQMGWPAPSTTFAYSSPTRLPCLLRSACFPHCWRSLRASLVPIGARQQLPGRRPTTTLPSTVTPMFAQAQSRRSPALRCEPGGHGHRLQGERRTQRHVLSASFNLDLQLMASALVVETFCLSSASASRILLPTADSWCCRARHAARCAPWLSWSSRPT